MDYTYQYEEEGSDRRIRKKAGYQKKDGYIIGTFLTYQSVACDSMDGMMSKVENEGQV